ncbi:MAG TPA: hypothetical protein VF008_06205, partial [Niastella sp.]
MRLNLIPIIAMSLCVLIAHLLTVSPLMSQVQISLERPKLTSSAPQAASAQKYVDYPVDHSV